MFYKRTETTNVEQPKNVIVDTCTGEPTPPDGGWGWFVVFGSFMIHFVTGGVTYTFGIFYVELLYYFNEGKGVTAWISSIHTGIMLSSGPVSSILVNKYGCRAVAIAGSILASLSLLASVWAPSIVVLYFTFGLGTGLGFGFMYLPSIVSVARYFEKYRSLATCIAVCGSGLGTLVFAPFIVYLIDNYGWRGTMMILSGVLLNGIIFGAMFRPLEPVNKSVFVPMKKHAWYPSSTMTLRKVPPSLVGIFISLQDTSKIAEQIPTRRQSTEITIENVFGCPDSSRNIDNAKEYCLNGHDDGTNVTRVDPSQMILTENGIVNRGPGSVEKSLGSNQSDTFYRGMVDSVRGRSKSFACSHENMTRRRASLRSLPGGMGYKKNDTLECLPNTKSTMGIVHPMLQLSLLKDPVFLLFTFSNFCTDFGFDSPFVYIVTQAEDRGINKDLSSDLIVIMGISDVVGRVVLGYIAGKPCINRLLLYNLCLTICGLSTALSVLCDSFLTFALYGAIFGVTGGANVGLTSVILVDLMGLEKLPNAFGLVLLFQGIASLLGPPAAGWLYDVLNSYDPCFFLAGSSIAISGLILFFIPPIQRRLRKKEDRERVH